MEATSLNIRTDAATERQQHRFSSALLDSAHMNKYSPNTTSDTEGELPGTSTSSPW